MSVYSIRYGPFHNNSPEPAELIEVQPIELEMAPPRTIVDRSVGPIQLLDGAIGLITN